MSLDDPWTAFCAGQALQGRVVHVLASIVEPVEEIVTSFACLDRFRVDYTAPASGSLACSVSNTLIEPNTPPMNP